MKISFFLGVLLLTVGISYSQSASRLEMARSLHAARKFEEARKLLVTIPKTAVEYAEAQYWLGRGYFSQEKYEEAADHFRQAAETDGQVADYWNWLGNTYGTIAQDANSVRQGLLAPKMRSAWEKAIALDPQNIEARSSLIQYYLRAPGFMGGSRDKAVEMARQIGQIDAAEGHRALGNIYYSEKKWQEAEREFVQMVQKKPATAPGLLSYYVNRQEYSRAFALIDKGLQARPDSMLLVYQYGRISALSGQRLSEGEKALHRYLAWTPLPQHPSHAGAHMRLGQICEKAGRTTEARAHYQKALAADPNQKEAKEGLARLKK